MVHRSLIPDKAVEVGELLRLLLKDLKDPRLVGIDTLLTAARIDESGDNSLR